LALIDEPAGDALRDLLGAPGVVGVVALALAGEGDANRVVEVISPNGIETVPAVFARSDESYVVPLVLGDEHHPPRRGRRAHAFGDFGEEVRRAVVDDGMGGVQPETVDVVLTHPV